MLTVFSLFWQFPQILIGCLIRIIAGGKLLRRIGHVRVFSWGLYSGLSLGWFCFVPEGADSYMIAHEYGHTRQSLLLGPFYLLVIGLPSFLWAVFWKILGADDYFSFYTERWAERLGERLVKS